MAKISQQLRFSVVIPCFNAENYISAALQSVLDQTIQPHEIIVIDDRSTDRSVERIQAFGDSVQLLHSTWGNGAGTRNVGIEAATGDWIAFLDADDAWYPNHLQRASELLADSEDVGFLNWYDHFFDQNPDERISRVNRLDIPEPTSGLSDQRFCENFARLLWFNMHGCVVNRKRLVDVGMLDPTQIRRHDIEMWFRVIKDHTWSFDPVPTTAYRMDTPGSISRNVSDASYYCFVAIKKNLEVIPANLRTLLIQKLAASAVVNALASGNQSEIERAFDEAFPYISRKNKVQLTLARSFPRAFKQLLNWRRSFQTWRREQRQDSNTESIQNCSNQA